MSCVSFGKTCDNGVNSAGSMDLQRASGKPAESPRVRSPPPAKAVNANTGILPPQFAGAGVFC